MSVGLSGDRSHRLLAQGDGRANRAAATALDPEAAPDLDIALGLEVVRPARSVARRCPAFCNGVRAASLVLAAAVATAVTIHAAALASDSGTAAHSAPLRSPELALDLVPTGTLGGAARAIVAADGVLFRGVGARVEVLSAAIPSGVDGGEPRPVRVGGSAPLPGVATGLARRGNLLFAAYTVGEPDWGIGGLSVLDAADLSRPLEVGRVELDVALQGVTLLDGLAIGVGYAGRGRAARGALVVLDVLDPARPRLLGRSDLAGEGIDVVAQGMTAYVLERESSANITLRAVSVSNPVLPADTDSVTVPGHPGDIAIGGSRLFVAAQAQGVYMFLPTDGVLGTPEPALDMPGAVACSAALAVDAAGERMAVGDACDYGVRILELPGHRPTSRGRAVLPEPPLSLAWHGSHVWGATGDFGGVYVADASNMIRPDRVASGPGLGAAEQVELVGDQAVVRSASVGLSARAADPVESPGGGAAAPARVRRLARDDLRDFAVAGTDAYALTTGVPGEVLEVALDEGEALFVERSLVLAAEGLELAVDAAAGDSDTLFARLKDDVTRAAAIDGGTLSVSPIPMEGEPTSGSSLDGIAAAGDRLYTTDAVRFAVHAAGPAGWSEPELVGRLDFGSWRVQPERGHLVVRGADAYALGKVTSPLGESGGVIVRVDISDPTSPREIGDWGLPAMPNALLPSAGYVFIASANALTAAGRPVADGDPLDLVAHADLPGPALDVAADGDLDDPDGARIAVAAGEAGVLLFHVRAAAEPPVEPSPAASPTPGETHTAAPPSTPDTPEPSATPGTPVAGVVRIHLPRALRGY